MKKLSKKFGHIYARIIVFCHGADSFGYTICCSTCKDDYGAVFSIGNSERNLNNDVFVCDGDNIFSNPKEAMESAVALCKQFGLIIQWMDYKATDIYGNNQWPLNIAIPSVPKKYSRLRFKKKYDALMERYWREVKQRKIQIAKNRTQEEHKKFHDERLKQIQKEISILGYEEVKFVPKRLQFVTKRTKLLKDLTAADVPPGLDPEDVAIDCDPNYVPEKQ